ncbi:GTP pyrophosphokinase [Oceanobacillus alkalisoli]|uniref:GTP pyrophosphokinase n=1 Tax=Oceanobacillus alkalisoli TaxID=2925113 RepID=UPI001EEF803B|nr:GTP pyrophosphokinase family protein [Oceanobacillus alkalisoli]MCF3943798.1 GTP pyrophosphokinase family protein [Oceanobacillus alkalisoli]MCG5103738.1 GTP pyrophosphokinase family protein [Oceanobacillus alkalisoli]
MINNLESLKKVRNELTRFMMTYQFGLSEMNTKLTILQEEFQHIHDYNPIEHIKTRIKSPESIMKKMYRKNIPISTESIKNNIMDIAGIRVVCSFISDIYRISEMIENQKDVTVIEKKDYIKNAKPNGYKSLHLIVSVPVFMSDRIEDVYVEIQIRTVAMDFWASLEHKIYYKYDRVIPERLTKELTEAAVVANDLDEKMEQLHNEVSHIKDQHSEEQDLNFLNLNEDRLYLPINFLKDFIKNDEEEK